MPLFSPAFWFSTLTALSAAPLAYAAPGGNVARATGAIARATGAIVRATGTIVIDPGHGGSDHGTVFDNGESRLAEKDVTLALAKEAAQQLRARGYRAVLTRAQDRDLPLAARTAMANRIGADVFLSIHMNSTATPMVSDAEGIETYILNNATDASSKRLAHLENSVITPAVGAGSAADPTDLALILKDLRLDGNLSDSKRLACALQAQLVAASRTGRARNRGVKQALFHVLLGADMPSVLIEAGFLTSPTDRALVLAPAGRAAIGRAIATAVDQYRRAKAPGAGSRALASSTLSKCKIH